MDRDTMARVKLVAAAGLCLAAAACTGSKPLVLVMPSGTVLRGSASTMLFKGDFYATDGKVTCSGPFTPSGGTVEVRATCSDQQRGEGSGAETSGDSGEGTLTMNNGKTATFIFGDAAKGR
jgi:hypothetical protein